MDRFEEAPSSTLAGIIRSGILPALLDLRDRMYWSIEIVDSSLNPIMGTGSDSTESRRLLSTLTAQPLRAAARDAMDRVEPTVVTIGTLVVVCTPIVLHKQAAGAVLVAGNHRATDSAVVRSRIERLGAWIAQSVELHATSPAAGVTSSMRQVSSLLVILRRAAAKGSEEDVVCAFVEALTVWQDVDAWGYRGTLVGTFQLAARLPGSTASVPEQLERGSVGHLTGVTRLSAEVARQLGFASDNELVVVPVSTDAAAEWLLVLPVAADEYRRSTVAVYCDFLGPALDAVAAVESLRLTWNMVEHLLDRQLTERFEVAHKALEDLSVAAGAHAWLTISTRAGGRVVTIDTSGDTGTPQDALEGRDISLNLDAGPLCVAALGLRAPADRVLTRRELTLLRSGAETLAPWIKAGAGRLTLINERRLAFRSFDRFVERQARHAAVRRDDVSIIVIALGAGAQFLEITQAWIAEVRRHLRATDMTGRLSSGDIGILLLETPPRRAHYVAQRLQQLIASDRGFGPLTHAGVGVAGWSGSKTVGSIIEEAAAKAPTREDPPTTGSIQ